ncbi:MAG: twin-arginine translocase TatA/TatE family subunit [Pyrinomonadaceae bacterium]
MPFLFLEFLGTTELLVIAVVALVLFGPRKLPQIGHSIGKSLSEFKRASEDFKRTWQMEVNMETADKEARIENAISPASPSTPVYARNSADQDESGDSYMDSADDSSTVVDDSGEKSSASSATETPAAEPAPVASIAPRKQDWL